MLACICPHVPTDYKLFHWKVVGATDRIILHALERGRYLADLKAPFVWIDRLYIVLYLRSNDWILSGLRIAILCIREDLS